MSVYINGAAAADALRTTGSMQSAELWSWPPRRLARVIDRHCGTSNCLFLQASTWNWCDYWSVAGDCSPLRLTSNHRAAYACDVVYISLTTGKFSAFTRSQLEQGVALTGRNCTGPPCSVGRPTAHVPGPVAVDRPRTRRPVRPSAGSVTDDDRRRQTTAIDDRRQTTASKTTLVH